VRFKDIENNPYVLEYIKASQRLLALYHYTNHGLDHAQLVSKRAGILARDIGFSKRHQELSAIAGFCHDFGNFLNRKDHEYWGALIFQNLFQEKMKPEELTLVMQAIANHDNYRAKIFNPIAAIVILADKSDVRRSRVIIKNKEMIESDIHNRVNFAVTANELKIDKQKKRITLVLKIDTSFVPVMEYFEIFTQRMVQCRKAAEFLGYKFALVINDFKLL
jgi:hypothetical protein